jgi:hypothetical protein
VSLSKEWLKAKDHGFHSVDQLMQRWEQRITARNLRLAERFLNLELHILLLLRIVESGIVWGVLLEKEIAADPVSVKKKVVDKRKQGSVLFDTVKLVDSPERIIPAFVWLEPIEVFYDLWPNAIYHSGLTGFVTSKALRDRKAVLFSDLVPSEHQEVTHQMIKGGAQIVGNVASPSQNVGGKTRQIHKSFDCAQALLDAESDTVKRTVTESRVFLADNYVRAICGQNVGCQIIEVLFGPLNFYANQNDSFVGCKQRSLLPE